MSEIFKKWKEILGLIVLLCSTGLSIYTWVTTKFALREYVDYNVCAQNKLSLSNDYTVKIYIMNEQLSKLYEHEATWEDRFKSKAIPITEVINFRKMNDDISKLQGDIKDYETKKKAQEDRDCVKEIRNSK